MSPARPAASATRALAWLYAPGNQRPLLAALYAIEDEIGASLRSGLDHQVAHLRLEWWRAECARSAVGRPAHPLTRALVECFAGRDPAPLAGLVGLVDAAIWDLAAATFETRRELAGYCERWADAIAVPLGQFAAAEVDAARLRALGAALREAELLVRIATDARAARLRLPLDQLAAAGVEPASVATPPFPPALTALLHERHALVRAELGAALAQLPHAVQPALRPLIVWAALSSAASRRAERRLPQALQGGDDQGLLDGWRAWRVARQAAKGCFEP